MKTSYAIFSRGESPNFCFYSLRDLPEAQRSIIQKYVDNFTSQLSMVLPTPNLNLKLSSSVLSFRKQNLLIKSSTKLESISNALHGANFFENFHDGKTFPFRGKGAMFIALVHTEDLHLLWVLTRVSLLKEISENNIYDMLIEEKIIIP
ncbi:MAG: hypothetical protein WCH65_01185 [bacterium]